MAMKSSGGGTLENDRNYSQSSKKGKKCEDLPVDVLINILSRVPGSSLLRFRCVCKLWCSLMRDPYLIDLHLMNSPKSNLPCIIINPRRPHWGIHLTVLDQAGVPRPSLTLDLDKYTRMTDPCNGLVGFYDDFTFYLCNLTTREVQILPIAKGRLSFSRARCFLGYHPVTKEYKVLRLVYTSQKDDLACEVFTLGTGSWREIGNFNCKFFRHTITVNGVIYWRGWSRSVSGRRTIVSFDLKEEKFILISLPSSKSYRNIDVGFHSLVEHEGSVCLVAFQFGFSVDVWILDGETNHAWIHKYHVIDDSIRHLICPRSVFFKYGKLLVHSDRRLFYYDLQSEILRCEEVYNIKDEGIPFFLKDIRVYVESLVSLRNIQGTRVNLGSSVSMGSH